MRLLLILSLACTLHAGLRTALPSDDEPQTRLFKREWVTERILAVRADARLNAAETGPGRLVYDLPEAEEPAIPGTPLTPSDAVGSRMASLGERVTYKDFRTGTWRPSEPALYTTRRGWIMAGGAVDTVIRPRPIQGGHFVGLHYADPDRGDDYYWTLMTFPAMTYDGDLRFTYQHVGVDWTMTLSENGDGYSIASAPISARASRTFSFPYQSSHSFTVDGAGNLVTGSIVMSRAVMVGANGVRYPCAAWEITTTPNTLSFTCDDAELPEAALPYVIDPTSQLVKTSGYVAVSIQVYTYEWMGETYYQWMQYGSAAPWVFDTSPLNIGSVTAASVVFSQVGESNEGGCGFTWGNVTNSPTSQGSWWPLSGVETTVPLTNLSKFPTSTDLTLSNNLQGPPGEPADEYASGCSMNIQAATLNVTYTIANTAPTLVSASAITGNQHFGPWITVTARIADAQGYSTIDWWHLLISNGVDGTYACYFNLHNRANYMYLMNDAGTDWGTARTMGTAVTLSNSQCDVDVANSNFTFPNGSTDVQATLRVRFKAPMMLNRNPVRTYLWAKDLSGAGQVWGGHYSEGYLRPKSKLIITSQN